MRILHTSDWHLGKSLYDFSLLDDQEFFIHRLLELLTKQPIDAVIIAGDIYDRPIPSSGAVQLYDYFLSRTVNELGIPVFAVAGNHDSASRLEFGSSLYQKSGYYIVGGVSDPLPLIKLPDKLGEVHFTLIPYLHPAEVRVLLEKPEIHTFDQAYRALLEQHASLLDPGKRNVAVAHGFFGRLDRSGQIREVLTSDSEINVGGMDIADTSCFSPFDYAALGHLHAPQQVCDHVRYSGSPLKYSLSEEHQHKSLTLIHLEEKGKIEQEAVILPRLRDLRSVAGTMENLLEPSYYKNQQFGDYVFAEIDGPESLYPMQKLRTLFPFLLGLRFSSQVPQQSLSPVNMKGQGVSRMSLEELFVRFYRQTKGEDLPTEYQQVIEEMLREEAGEVSM